MTTPSEVKLQELILYIAEQSEGDLYFGKTKLHKTLFYADFISYARTGHPITGLNYVKRDHGPFLPEVSPTLAALQEQRAVAMAHRDVFGWSQERPCALREPNLDGFTGQEIAIVDQVIRALWDKSAKDVSDLSHQFIGWKVALLGEIIPYETATVDNSEPTDEEEAYARELAAAGL